MVHQCNLHCHTIDPSKADLMGIDDDGKWMPFIFHMDLIEAAKLTSDEGDKSTYGCTTIFTRSGEAYIIDTPYEEFFKLYRDFCEPIVNDEDDLNL